MHSCAICTASFSRKQTYDHHLLSLKHLNRIENKALFTCTCGKKYACREGLSRNRVTCAKIPNDQLIKYYEQQLQNSNTFVIVRNAVP